jgi:hypothetical protein
MPGRMPDRALLYPKRFPPRCELSPVALTRLEVPRPCASVLTA